MTRIRIGLMRHLEVAMPMPTGWLSASDLTRWRTRYDEAGVNESPLETGGIAWQRCLSSDLPRAMRTAQLVFAGEVEATPLLREPEVAEFRTGRLRLPQAGWRWLLRAAWMTGHASQDAARREFLSRVSHVADQVIATAREDTLIVSHAGIMVFLRSALVRAGFTGPSFRLAAHGKLYLFERTVDG